MTLPCQLAAIMPKKSSEVCYSGPRQPGAPSSWKTLKKALKNAKKRATVEANNRKRAEKQCERYSKSNKKLKEKLKQTEQELEHMTSKYWAQTEDMQDSVAEGVQQGMNNQMAWMGLSMPSSWAPLPAPEPPLMGKGLPGAPAACST